MNLPLWILNLKTEEQDCTATRTSHQNRKTLRNRGGHKSRKQGTNEESLAPVTSTHYY
ncbi:hypothetical protein ANANG_G00034880 [Anguilla anguilla]|uniref:Uncharacterized protein n=1 Tax=Anguilla anguilla TaxID=7936 RepID=A0A9D3S461_ANGAN|nr:hypothetical protein ANANG_G00034880 [Anguilla anguilla]